MTSLRHRILSYFRRNPDEWIPSADIQRMVMNKTTFLPRTAVRALQKLQEDGRLEVDYRGRKNHSHYRYIKSPYEVKHEEFSRS